MSVQSIIFVHREHKCNLKDIAKMFENKSWKSNSNSSLFGYWSSKYSTVFAPNDKTET